MKNITLILILIIPINVVLSQSISIGEKKQIESRIYNGEREIWIHLPEHYDSPDFSSSTYPVLYVLDGEWLFKTATAVVESLSGGLYRYMPEAIIVGIINTDRSRDLTPSNDTVLHNNMPIHTTSGGASEFLKFIETELGDYINTNYRTNGYNMLCGHSFGGLFTIYALLQQNEFFSAFIAHDPSLWWDNQILLNELVSNWDQYNFEGKQLYLSIAAYDTTEVDRFKHSHTIIEFQQFIDSHKDSSFHFEWESFEKEDHGTIQLPATFNGLRTLFKGITLPVKKVPYNTRLIEERYQQLSTKLGHTLIPEEDLLDSLAKYCKRVKQKGAELDIREMHVRFYPNSSFAHSTLAECYYQNNMPTYGDKHKTISTQLKQSSNSQ